MSDDIVNVCYECSQWVFSVMVTQRKSGFKFRNIRFEARVRICNNVLVAQWRRVVFAVPRLRWGSRGDT
jgi:hypothetical protein